MESTEGTRARRAVPLRATARRAWGGAVGPHGRSAHERFMQRGFHWRQGAGAAMGL
jgi:hypothetical protein